MQPTTLDIPQIIKDLDLKIIHYFDRLHNLGGVTIVYKKCENHRNSRMVEVAVSYCSPHDTYNRKLGTRIAVERFYYNETVTVPARTNNCDDTIENNLMKMFGWIVV